MNPSIARVCAVVAAGLSLAVTKAHAQADIPPDQDWIFLCDDICTEDDKYSDDFGNRRLRDDLFGVAVGISGTAAFETCFGTSSFSANSAGRIGFQIGRIGSIQDELIEGRQIDDDLMLTFGMPTAPGANWGYAKIVRRADDGTLTFTSFADDDSMDSYYYGASDRYFQVQDTADDCLVTLRVDLLGDAARLNWKLENQTDEASALGLWFGQWVVGLGPQGPGGMAFVNVPGQRPINTDTRFASDVQNIVPPASSLEPAAISYMPDHVDFGISQAWAYGLQIINSPTNGANSSFPDQTQVDTLDIGGAGAFRSPSLLGIMGANDRPMSPTYSALWNDVLFIREGAGLQDTGYIQRWNPISVGPVTASVGERTREIIAYYKPTTSTSNYAAPYSIVVDAPRTIAVQDSNPNQFNPATSTVRVYIDNTRGFTTNNQRVPLNDVRIQLDLPQGMSDANDPTHTRTRMVKTIATVPATTPPPSVSDYPAFKFVDFPVYVAPEVSGTQYYSVTVAANPGPTKVVNGSINVASTPRLLIKGDAATPEANLVTAPWDFGNSTWDAILGGGTNPLQRDTDYQAFTWDPQRQEYVIQTSAQRGIGTFLISKVDVGYKALGGNPKTPSDLATGSSLVTLKKGWNLIANPYNYPIQLGQIVCVTETDSSHTRTFQELAQAGIITASLAYWDRNTQSYKFTTDFTSEMLPNVGYWINVTTVQDVFLSYPPVFTPFIPQGTGGISKAAGWSLNVVARTKSGLDDQNFIGIAKDNAQAAQTRIMEPPIAPTSGAITASFREGSTQFAKSLKPKASTLTWNMEVTPRSNDTVTLTWPSVSSVPNSVSLRLTDTLTKRSYDMRTRSSYTYFGQARATQRFVITAEDRNAAPIIGSANAVASTRSATISYQLSEASKTSVRVLQSGRQIAQLTRNRNDRAASVNLAWNLKDSANRRVKPGVYVAEISATSASGRTETRTISFLVR